MTTFLTLFLVVTPMVVDATDIAPWTTADVKKSGRQATCTGAGGTMTVVLLKARLNQTHDEVLAWVGQAASDVQKYFGHVPVVRPLKIIILHIA